MALPTLPYEENCSTNPPSPVVVTIKLSKKKKMILQDVFSCNEGICSVGNSQMLHWITGTMQFFFLYFFEISKYLGSNFLIKKISIGK